MVFIEILKLTVHSLVVVWCCIRKVKVFCCSVLSVHPTAGPLLSRINQYFP